MEYSANLGRTGFLDIEKIKNADDIPENIGVKPRGCLWADRLDSEHNWKAWCMSEEPEWLSFEDATIVINDNARILELSSQEVLDEIEEKYGKDLYGIHIPGEYSIDWNKLSRDYDVVEFRLDEFPEMYMELYTIDCDSVAILNKEAIKEIRNPETVTMRSEVTDIEINPGTTEIKEKEYAGCFSLKSVEIPEGVTTIEKSAFWECESLESVNFPSTLKIIENKAFDWCVNLKEIVLPENIEKLEGWPFDDNTSVIYKGRDLTSAEYVDKGLNLQETLDIIKQEGMSKSSSDCNKRSRR